MVGGEFIPSKYLSFRFSICLRVLISVKSARFISFSAFFYFAGFTNCADYNYFTDFVKMKIRLIPSFLTHFSAPP